MKFLIAATLAAATFFACQSCKTDTGDPKKDRRGRVTNAVLKEIGKFAEHAAFSALADAGSQVIEGRQVDFAHAGVAGLNANINSIDTAEAARAISDAWTGHQVPQLGIIAAQAFTKANPQTAADKAAVVKVIAQSFSNAASSVVAP